jgi:hypothetical protein
MSSVVTGREFGGVLVRPVADSAVFLGSRVVNIVSDSLTLAAVSDARVCAHPRVCAPPCSGAGGSCLSDRSYHWMSSVRVCALPLPIRQVSCGPGVGRGLWFFIRGLGRRALLRRPKVWSRELMVRRLPGATTKAYILIGIGRCQSRVPKPPPWCLGTGWEATWEPDRTMLTGAGRDRSYEYA